MKTVTEEERQSYIKTRWADIKAPRRYIDAKIELTDKTFSDFVDAVDNNRDVFIYGSIGTGKTYISCAYYKLVIDYEINEQINKWIESEIKSPIYLNPNYDVFGLAYTTEFDILEHRKMKFDKESISYLEYLYICPSLTIDELGKFNNDEKSTNYIEELISKRYNNGLGTILITNLTIKDFKDLYGDRLMDRLRGNNVHIIKKVGDSLRGKKD